MRPSSSEHDSVRSPSTRRYERHQDVWLVLCAFIPAALTAALITHYWTDGHLADEWNSAVLLAKFGDGTLTLWDLWAQQNEYRQFFPNLVFVAVGWVTRWDVRYWMVLSFLAACAVSLNIYVLEKRTLNLTTTQRLIVYALSNLLIFSPVQYENWLQGQQLIYFFPIVCVTTGLVVSTSRLSWHNKLVLCALASTVSTFSSANGILCWLIVFPVLWFSVDELAGRHSRWIGFVWSICAFVNVLLYLYRFRSVPWHPSLLTVFSTPLAAVVYFLSLLGGPLSLAPSVMFAMATGLVVLSVGVWLSFDFWKKRKSYDAFEMRRRLCWLMLGTYSLATAVLITVGRIGFGVWQSRMSRYTTFSLYLIVALLHLIAIKFMEPRTYVNRIDRRLGSRAALCVLAGGLVLLHVGIYALAVRHFSNFKLRFVQAKACVPFINVIDSDECATVALHDYPEILKSRANGVDALGFIRPQLVKTNRIQDIEGNAGEATGSFEALTNAGEDTYVASGRAFIPRRNEPADAVLLVYERPPEPATIFKIAYLNSDRDYISYVLHRGVYGDSRWKTEMRVDTGNLTGATVTAWAYDLNTGKAYKLAGSFVLAASPRSENGQ